MNIMCTSVNKSAHKPYPRLFSILSKDSIPMTYRQRWKLLQFIETLSGQPIGFYCLDLFPMNRKVFSQYLYFAGANYLLLMNFFK